ncbi:transposase [Algoriphagus sp. C2-6-M1]|uniref:IS66 family transposase n=1 Tax=Algoriphagus persicinus TaxID=3108754 RepID=UPI002B3EC741|nr:transposase [Algoriphagus sp. C2-6-M1]MEB2782145.1 transposase [Algoriphagus sp. C2-6-M1]
MRWISSTDLHSNSGKKEFELILPELIRKLIIASCTSFPDFHIPIGDSIYKPGFDVKCNIDEDNDYVPTGESVWELGRDEDFLGKCNEEYKKRTSQLDKALPVLDAFSQWLKENYVQVLPKSSIGLAMAYTMNRWEELNNYLKDWVLEVDNNAIENKLRGVALGRKNYLFAGSHDAAQRAAMIYSFFAMCKYEEVNPQQWLKYVFDNIMDTNIQKIQELLPKNYKLSLVKKSD